MTKQDAKHVVSRLNRWAVWLIVALLVYLVSSGPMVACGFWLAQRGWEWTGYVLVTAYSPLGDYPPFNAYIGWWVEGLGTQVPG